MVPITLMNAEGRSLRLSDGAAQRLADLPRTLPLLILIHGYKYSPRWPERDPHRYILGTEKPGGGRSAP